MRIFCPAIGLSRPSSRWSWLPPPRTPTPAVGRVANLRPAATVDVVGVLGAARHGSRADRVSWFGTAAQGHRHTSETRFSGQELPHPGNPPEQPDYLRRPWG